MVRAHRKILLPGVAFLACLALSGCTAYDEVMKTPITEWSTQQSLLVLTSCMQHNLFDFRSPVVKVFAIPYYPSVIVASERVWRDRSPVPDSEFRASTEQLARANAGLYIDWKTNRFVDGRGNYFRGPLQLDSLMFMIRLDVVGFSTDWPYIGDLERRIYLVNDKGLYIKPRYVWGRHQEVLAFSGESLLAMFPLRVGDHHFLEGSSRMYLVIKGFDADITLTYDLSRVR